jgi:Flp pilus assembly protein TadD
MQPSIHSTSRYQTASSLIARGDRVRGYHLLSHLLEGEPTHVPALLLRGEVLYARRRFRSARQDFQSVLKLDPTNAKACVFMGLIGGLGGLAAESRVYLERALRLAPDDPSIRWLVADSCFHLGHVRTARRHLSKVHTLRPHDPRVMCDLGYCHAHEAEWVEAMVWFDRALQIDPNHSPALLELGKIAILRGMVDHAQHYLRRLLRMHPRSEEGLTTLAYLHHYRGHREQALDAVRKALAIDGHHLPALLLVGGLEVLGRMDPDKVARAVRSLSDGELLSLPFVHRGRRPCARYVPLPLEAPDSYRR